jgi:hypothetical protein
VILPRVVAAETLDHLAPDDPVAMRSRRDLRRVHRVMGTHAIVCRGWRALMLKKAVTAPLHVLELGAGDGSLLLGVARVLAPRWQRVQLTLLDRQSIVAPATLAGFAERGWSAQTEVIDVLEWAAGHEVSPPGRPGQRWDLIVTTLFLHHFEGGDLDRLLAAVAARCDRFFACEPRRTRLALAGSHLIGAIGANAVTRGDAVLSVHAGFRDLEISARWPHDVRLWQTREFTAGLFSQCFSALRTTGDP